MKRVLLETDRLTWFEKHQRKAVYALGIGFLLICLGLAIKALWSL